MAQQLQSAATVLLMATRLAHGTITLFRLKPNGFK